MKGALKYVATVEYSYVSIDFEFYTVEEAAEFAGEVLRHYKPDSNKYDIRVYISIADEEEEE